MKAKLITKWLLALVVGLVITWDIVAILAGGVEATVSRVVVGYSQNCSWLPLSVGVVGGHLFSGLKKWYLNRRRLSLSIMIGSVLIIGLINQYVLGFFVPPYILFCVGIILGHFFWPQKIK